jgi:membrane-bound lytic murein transglycosylase D
LPVRFSADERLKKAVNFWVGIYTQYDTSQGLIHDAKYVDHVYEVIRPSMARAAKKKWKDVLLSLHRKKDQPDTWTEDEKKVAKMFEDISEPNKFLNAAHRKRMRFQLGQKNQFIAGYKSAGRYLPMMEEVFKKEGLPVELTRLPFVESSFNLKARSKVGASGIWQFMRSTGRLFLRVDDAVDERNDPIRATEAAARLLKMNYESLGSWPLAVTAYNHGRKGIMRAVRKVGTSDLETLVAEYRTRSFGFASSNFFVELLAAIESEKRLSGIDRDPVVEGVEVRIPDFIEFNELCRFLSLKTDVLKELNPALSDAVLKGRLLIPAGYVLRLPADKSLGKEAQARLFHAGYAQIPALFKLQAQKKPGYGERARSL